MGLRPRTRLRMWGYWGVKCFGGPESQLVALAGGTARTGLGPLAGARAKRSSENAAGASGSPGVQILCHVMDRAGLRSCKALHCVGLEL